MFSGRHLVVRSVTAAGRKVKRDLGDYDDVSSEAGERAGGYTAGTPRPSSPRTTPPMRDKPLEPGDLVRAAENLTHCPKGGDDEDAYQWALALVEGIHRAVLRKAAAARDAVAAAAKALARPAAQAAARGGE